MWVRSTIVFYFLLSNGVFSLCNRVLFSFQLSNVACYSCILSLAPVWPLEREVFEPLIQNPCLRAEAFHCCYAGGLRKWRGRDRPQAFRFTEYSCFVTVYSCSSIFACCPSIFVYNLVLLISSSLFLLPNRVLFLLTYLVFQRCIFPFFNEVFL